MRTHHYALGAINALLFVLFLGLTFHIASAPADHAYHPTTLDLPWAPPAWFPAETHGDLWVLDGLEGDGHHEGKTPKIPARSAIIADLDSGKVLFSRNADSPYPVASLTKLVSGLTLASAEPDLDQELCLSMEQWPSRSGAKSRFETGTCQDGWAYLGAAMVASDNRGAFALPALSGLEYGDFIEQMNQVSGDLKMGATWADPSGLEDENMATARDMLKAVVAASLHPTMRAVATAPYWDIDRKGSIRRLFSTNRLKDNVEVLAAKTGYTDTARYCYATVAQTTAGRRLGVVVLGANSSNARFNTALSLIRWSEQQEREAR